MATNHTQNYALNLWEPADKFVREEFNENSNKIDAAIKAVDAKADTKASATAVNALTQTVNQKGNCRIVVGSYTGTGENGQDHPNTLTFPFKPEIVFIGKEGCTSASDFALAIQGQTYFCSAGSNGGSYNCCATWSGSTFSWYSSYQPDTQFNRADQLYFYVALG